MSKKATTEIKRNVPIPPPAKRGPPYKYAWADMLVGDMITYEGCVQAASSCANLFNGRRAEDRKKPFEFAYREVEVEVGGETKKHTNVWRVK